MRQRLAIGLVLLGAAVNACAGLLTFAAQNACAPVSAQTVYDGD